MDIKTEQELLRIENHLTMTFSKLITDGFKDIKESITELFNKDIEYIKDTQGRFAHHHNEHFQNYKDVKKDISEIEKKITEIVIEHKTQDHLEDKTDRNKNTNYAFIGVIFLIIGFFSSFLFK